MTLHSQN